VEQFLRGKFKKKSSKMEHRGIFITFEGGEGAGKTVLAKRVFQELAKSYSVILTSEPGDTTLGRDLRHIVLHRNPEMKVCREAELLLYLADRAQHIDEVIKPALQEDKIVLCDRYIDASMAYQGGGRELGIDFVEKACHIATKGLIPDLTILVDVDPEEGIRRIERRNGKAGRDQIEKEQMKFHHRVRDAYLTISRKYPERYAVIDGSKSELEVFHDTMAVLNERIMKK
jgi:dTMP kinase